MVVSEIIRNFVPQKLRWEGEGGLDIRGEYDDTRTPAQKIVMRTLLEELHARYPRAVILGHHDLDPRKPCPCIKDVAKEYADLNGVRARSRSTK